MAVKEAKDVQVYTGSQWKTLKDQQVYDGSSWRKFGVGSGVSDGGDWYVLKSNTTDPPPQTIIDNCFDVTIRPDLDNWWVIDVEFLAKVESKVTLKFSLRKFDQASKGQDIEIVFSKGDQVKRNIKTNVSADLFIPPHLDYFKITPEKDGKYKYFLRNLYGGILYGAITYY